MVVGITCQIVMVFEAIHVNIGKLNHPYSRLCVKHLGPADASERTSVAAGEESAEPCRDCEVPLSSMTVGDVRRKLCKQVEDIIDMTLLPWLPSVRGISRPLVGLRMEQNSAIKVILPFDALLHAGIVAKDADLLVHRDASPLSSDKTVTLPFPVVLLWYRVRDLPAI